MEYVGISLALTGYLVNIKGKLKLSYSIWLVSNLIWAIFNFNIGLNVQGSMMVCYSGFCIYGICKK
jgi:hypothetical protein